MYDEKEVMRIVNNICNMQSTDCRSLNKISEARKLLDILDVPQDAVIYEIPVDWANQTVVCFEFQTNGKNEAREGFEVFAGESQKDGEFCLEINRTRFDEEGYLIDDGHCNIVFEALDLDYFSREVIV